MFSEDPLFCNPSIGDVGLREGSPCLPGPHGARECGLIGAYPAECGLIPVLKATWGSIKKHFGAARD